MIDRERVKRRFLEQRSAAARKQWSNYVYADGGLHNNVNKRMEFAHVLGLQLPMQHRSWVAYHQGYRT